jgi:hypothetical protein
MAWVKTCPITIKALRMNNEKENQAFRWGRDRVIMKCDLRVHNRKKALEKANNQMHHSTNQYYNMLLGKTDHSLFCDIYIIINN